MSMQYCFHCEEIIDTDFEAEHFDEHPPRNEAQQKIDELSAEIMLNMQKPNYKPETSEQVRQRAKRHRDMETSVYIQQYEAEVDRELSKHPRLDDMAWQILSGDKDRG